MITTPRPVLDGITGGLRLAKWTHKPDPHRGFISREAEGEFELRPGGGAGLGTLGASVAVGRSFFSCPSFLWFSWLLSKLTQGIEKPCPLFGNPGLGKAGDALQKELS